MVRRSPTSLLFALSLVAAVLVSLAQSVTVAWTHTETTVAVVQTSPERASVHAGEIDNSHNPSDHVHDVADAVAGLAPISDAGWGGSWAIGSNSTAFQAELGGRDRPPRSLVI